MKSLLTRTTAVLFTATCFLGAPMAFAQEKTEAEQLEELKSVTLACAVIYQVQLDANVVSDRTLYTSRQTAMQGLYAIIAEKPETEAAAEVSELKAAFDNLRVNDAEKYAGFFNLCETLSSDE